MFGSPVRNQLGLRIAAGIAACRPEFARFTLVLAVVIGLLAAPATIHAEVDAAKLYGQHCVKCHGADGSGKAARAIEPAIPDFTAAAWQAKRSDKHVLDSILDGKGETMPGYRKKVTEEESRALASHVRAFAPVRKKANPKEADQSGSDDFAQRFRQLQAELEALQKQFRQLSEASDVGKSSPPPVPDKAAASPPRASVESSVSAATMKKPTEKVVPETMREIPLGAVARNPNSPSVLWVELFACNSYVKRARIPALQVPISH